MSFLRPIKDSTAFSKRASWISLIITALAPSSTARLAVAKPIPAPAAAVISTLLPNILAKGGDYDISTIVGHEVVQNNGGEVILIPFVDGFSSTDIIDRIKNS